MASQTNIARFNNARRVHRGVSSSTRDARPSVSSRRAAGQGKVSASAARPKASIRVAASSRDFASRGESRRSVAEERSVRSASPRAAISGGSARQMRAESDDRKTLRSRADAARKERVKARAERQFSRQYAGASAAGRPEEGAPRAALYRGEMGTRQKRATRMQGDAPRSMNATEVKTKRRSFKYAPALVAVIAAVACVVFACGFLYTPAQTYYLSLRQHDQLQAEYQAVLDRNDSLQDELNTLSTEEGVKQFVHDQYGWVSDGENAVVVQGLSDGSENGMNDVSANVVPGSVSAPDTWYSSVLDPFFGYNQ